MPITSLQDLYLNKLQLTHDAERQILEALPQLAQAVQNPELRNGLEAHRRQTEEQVRRLEQIFQREGQRPQSIHCTSMRALIQEGQQLVQQVQDPDTRDALIIAAAQAVEHHEIAAYGTARTWARQLGRTEDAEALQQTLREEEQTDKQLTEIAERMVNVAAAQGQRGAAAQGGAAERGAGRGAQRRERSYAAGEEEAPEPRQAPGGEAQQ